MAGIARVILVGNLTRDPELTTTQGGTSVCNLGVAVNQRVKQNGQWTDYASFFDCVCFGSMAEACASYLSRGAQVALDGELRQERWQDKSSGDKRSKIKVYLDNIQFPPKGDGGGGSGGGQQRTSNQQGAPRADFATPVATFEAPQADFGLPDDDIPFVFLDTIPVDGVVWQRERLTWPSAELPLW